MFFSHTSTIPPHLRQILDHLGNIEVLLPADLFRLLSRQLVSTNLLQRVRLGYFSEGHQNTINPPHLVLPYVLARWQYMQWRTGSESHRQWTEHGWTFGKEFLQLVGWDSNANILFPLPKNLVSCVAASSILTSLPYFHLHLTGRPKIQLSLPKLLPIADLSVDN